MALRDKLADRMAPHLEPGEQLRQVFMAQSGPSPYWVILTWLTLFWNKYLIVAVTDRGLVTARATAFKPSFVKNPPVIARSPRPAVIGPCSGFWSKIELEGSTFHVHKRFHKDIDAANDEAAHFAATSASAPAAVAAQPVAAAQPVGDVPAGWYPDPHGQAAQRYWDGANWTEHTA